MPAMCNECRSSIPLSESYCELCKPVLDLDEGLKLREAQLLAITDRDELDESNPIGFAEAGPNRFRLLTLFFEDVVGGANDGVRVQEDLDLNEISVEYFNNRESVELKEGALYEWALDFYRND
jgi:hypothetical protein